MELFGIGGLIALAVLAILGLLVVLTTFFTVQHQTAAIVQRFGKHHRIAGPGLRAKVPFIDSVVFRQNLRVLQLNVPVDTKTKDNVFVKVIVSVQYYVLPEKIYESFYKLADPHTQICSYVFDVVRAKVPGLELDHVFEKKDDIANEVKRELGEVMSQFGYAIEKALVTDIEPDAKVKEAMNDINAAQRQRVAALERGEADKILKVKAAEAEAESKALQGAGIARQRKAIVDGLKESVAHFQEAVEGTTAQDVMTMVLLTQYFDTIGNLVHGSKTNTILIPHSPGALGDLNQQLRDAIIAGNQVPAAPPENDTEGGR